MPHDVCSPTTGVTINITSADHSRLKWTIAFGIVLGAIFTSIAGFLTLLLTIALTQIG
jgi:hypothetical protein